MLSPNHHLPPACCTTAVLIQCLLHPLLWPLVAPLLPLLHQVICTTRLLLLRFSMPCCILSDMQTKLEWREMLWVSLEILTHSHSKSLTSVSWQRARG